MEKKIAVKEKSQAVKEKKPVGKPKGSGLQQVLTPAMVRRYAAQGMKFEEIGLMFGYTKQWIGNIIGRNPELQAAWEQGNARLSRTLTSALMRCVKKGEAIPIIFYLKCRCGWIEEQYRRDSSVPPIAVSVYLPDNGRDVIDHDES